MLKITTKKNKSAIIVVLILSMLLTYFYAPLARAASLTDAKDVISNSNISAPNVNHTISFITGVVIPNGGYVTFTFPAGFNLTLATTTCMGTTTPQAIAGQVARCNASSGNVATGTKTAIIATTTNPVAGSYTISISTKDGGGTELEKADVKVYILSNISVTGHVDSSLTFQITGINPGQNINGALTTATSTATTTTFGTLDPTGATSTVGQELSVSTNATDGYTVTVMQDHELQSAGGANINSFNNAPTGTGSTTPIAWVNPLGLLNNSNTWGHMALTSNDADVVGTDFTSSKYAGLAGVSPLAIMSHTGPADGSTQNIGKARVAYSIKITALQEAGDYTNTLTYICTPQF